MASIRVMSVARGSMQNVRTAAGCARPSRDLSIVAADAPTGIGRRLARRAAGTDAGGHLRGVSVGSRDRRSASTVGDCLDEPSLNGWAMAGRKMRPATRRRRSAMDDAATGQKPALGR
jgi:hypothetical protein